MNAVDRLRRTAKQLLAEADALHQLADQLAEAQAIARAASVGSVSGKALTVRQRVILDFIVQHLAEHGVPPTLREIGAHTGIGSTNLCTIPPKRSARGSRVTTRCARACSDGDEPSEAATDAGEVHNDIHDETTEAAECEGDHDAAVSVASKG